MFSFFPKDDHEQTVRIKRFLMAFASYFLWCSISAFTFVLGLMPVPLYILVGCLSGIIIYNISIYAIIRTGFNKRFKDPSLTLFQMVIATLWAMVFLYYAGSARSAFLLLYLVVFVFGLFRLKVREFLFLSLFAVVNYAAITLLLYKFHPESINVKTDLLYIVILATVLPWFSLIGGYITRLRVKIYNAFSTIEKMTDNIQDVIFILDMNLKYTYISHSVKILRGYEPEEVLKQSPFDAITPASLDLGMRTLSEVMELEKIEHKEDIFRTLQLEIRRKDGTTVWTETKFTFIRNKDKQPVGILGVMRDITERKKAEDALQNSEELYTKLVNTIPDSIVRTDLEGKILFVNDHTLQISGYEREEIEGQNILTFVSPEEHETMIKNVLLMIEHGLGPREYNLIMKDGRKMPFEIHADVLRNEDGTPLSIVSVCRNISERKRTEDRLKKNEERLRGITENLPGIIFQFYAKNSGEFAVNYFSKPLGEFSEVIENIDTKNMDELFPLFLSRIHEEDRNSFLNSIKIAVETGTSWNFEGRVVSISGKTLWVQGLSTPTHHEDQLVFNGILLNITDRRKAEEELRESEEWFRNYMENAPDGVYISDVKGTFLYGNRKSEELIGYKREELIGKNFLELNILSEKSLDKAAQLLQENMKGNRTGPDEIELIGKDGRLIPVEINTSLVQRRGQEIVLAFVRDITNRKQTEEALRESERRYHELSIMDDLTQLYNSRHFHEQLEKEIERSNRYAHPLALLMLDIDKFKDFNDTYGHVEGDQVLLRLGQVVKGCLRETDSAYRYGGEEFMIMLPMTTGEEGIVIAKRIQTKLRKEAFSPVPDQKIYMTVSIGLARYKPKEDMKTFVRRVDQLMYQAKKEGRDRICSES